MFGKVGLMTDLQLCIYNNEDEFTRNSLMVIYHTVMKEAKFSLLGIRSCILTLVKRGILWKNPIHYWLENFLVMLLRQDWKYFCAESSLEYEKFKVSVFVFSSFKTNSPSK